MRRARGEIAAACLGVAVLVLGAAGCGKTQEKDSSEGGLSGGDRQTERPAPVLTEAVSPPRLYLSRTDHRAEASSAPHRAASRVLAPPDLTGATMEIEPNDDRETASPLDGSYSGRGQLQARERDIFSFEAEGEAQLWSIEARGDNLQRLLYLGSRGVRQAGKVSPDDPALHTLTNLFLLPGKHWLEVKGAGGSAGNYTIRAVPLGRPESGMELEPNDTEEGAHRLRFGVERIGHLFETGDIDQYRFNLNAEEQIALEFTPPRGVAAKLIVEPSSRKAPVVIDVPQADGSLRYRAVLPFGEHRVLVRAQRGRSDDPYVLRLDRLNRFLPAVDREPNDTPHEAAPFPTDLQLVGSTRGRSDPDWYQLPRRTTDTPVTVELSEETKEGFPGRDGLRLFDAAGEPSNPGLIWDGDASVYRGTLIAGADRLLRVQGFGPYQYQFVLGEYPVRTGEAQVRAAADPEVAMALPAGTHRVAAFWPQRQRLELKLGLKNTGSGPHTVDLEAATTNLRWRAELRDQRVDLAAGEATELPVVIQVARDAWGEEPVDLMVRGTDETGAVQTATARLDAACGAPAIDPQPFQPLPDALLGGLDLAWSALGSRAEGDGKPDMLFDGFTPNDQTWKAKLPATVTVELADSRVASIAGVILNPQGKGPPSEKARGFAVEVSSDGKSFQSVLSTELGREPYEQAFAFEHPVEARFVRLRVLSSQVGDEGSVALGEFGVIAAPGELPDPASPLDLGAARAGAHVVWSDPIIHRSQGLLTADAEEPKVRLHGLSPLRWVVGFQHGRAALVERLEWVQPAQSNRHVKVMTQVQVAASVESPTGPWAPIGTWELDSAPGSISRLNLPDARWVRYLRFTHSQAEGNAEWYLSEALRVYEAGVGNDYRSILGEWGQYSRSAVYEWSLGERSLTESSPDSGGDSRTAATPLELDQAVSDEVELDHDVDWYRIQVPEGHNRLALDLRGRPDLRAIATLYDGDEQPLPLEKFLREQSAPPVLDASVTPGDYWLRLEEPPRSVVFVWDNSGSVGPYRATIYKSLAGFATGIRRGSEFANLLPFQGPGGKLLVEDWTDDPQILLRAVNNYDQSDSSSDAESALVQATDGLAARPGAKALVLLTDAEFGGAVSKPRLWSLLNEVRPRVFTLEIHRGRVSAQQDMMQSWAAVNGGHYTHFSSNADLEIAFERASCLLRRPAGYTLTASSRFQAPPAPGLLSVDLQEGVAPSHAIELILDASGSMLQRLGSKRRIEIARDVLLDLVGEVLPPRTPLALRIFGHREANSCRSDLEVPLAPLDREQVASVIKQTQARNLAKTPIADSLRHVSQDLASATGQRLVVLITDGEETCDGDPEEAVAELAAAGIDVRLNIVGFAIEDEVLKADFSRWAGAGGGRYFDAVDEAALSRSVRSALQPKYQAIDEAGNVAAEGTVGGPAVELPAGHYSVRVLTSPLRTFEAVEIESETLKELTVDGSE